MPGNAHFRAFPEVRALESYYPSDRGNAPRTALLTPDDVLDCLWDLGCRQAARLVRSSTEQERRHRQPFPPGEDPGDSLFFPGDEWGSSLGLR